MDADEPAPAALVALQGTPGTEHLSAMRKSDLVFIAKEAKLQYVRLGDGKHLIDLLTAPRHTVTRPTL